MQANSDFLCQTWIYAQEESSREVMVYYAEGYPLPPARGRQEMTFEPAGRFIKRVIAPACGLDEIPGTWQWQPNGNVVIYLSDGRSSWQFNYDDVPRPSGGLRQGRSNDDLSPFGGLIGSETNDDDLRELGGVIGWQSNDGAMQKSERLGDMELVILSLTEQQLRIEAAPGLLYA